MGNMNYIVRKLNEKYQMRHLILNDPTNSSQFQLWVDGRLPITLAVWSKVNSKFPNWTYIIWASAFPINNYSYCLNGQQKSPAVSQEMWEIIFEFTKSAEQDHGETTCTCMANPNIVSMVRNYFGAKWGSVCAAIATPYFMSAYITPVNN